MSEQKGLIPARYAPVLFGFLLSGLMSLIVSGIATLRATGLPPNFPAIWFQAWLPSWGVAFPTVLVVAPLVRRVVARLTLPPPAA
ncbi:DUF2798 domain-containing protein [Indioceanicola profundi]|uniref:DUF2798 domain-containing protein n=1 Tax=Indioceanicola profundi TaxID=2220096 RepID=UPI001968FE05|nr:DUF2798 domain-containing protein [Indioceanicola profundi]